MKRACITGCLAILILGGCSAKDLTPSDTLNAAFSQQVADALEGAKGAGASEEQLATLEEIALAGEVTFEQYKAGHLAGLACMEEAGLVVSEPYSYNEHGTEVFTADVTQPAEMTEEAFLALLDSCDIKHSLFIDNLYYTQPSAIAAWGDLIESHRDEILECFASLGATFDENITWQEMETLREETVLAQREIDKSQPPIDCYWEAGVFADEG